MKSNSVGEALFGQIVLFVLFWSPVVFSFPLKDGALYVADCSQNSGLFSCRQFLMKFDPTQTTGVITVPLKRVDQTILAPSPLVKAAVVDRKRGIAYLHGGCTGTYIMTHLRTGISEVFKTPGIQCLQNFIVDEDSGRVLALGGSAVPDNSSIDSLVQLSPDGRVEVLFDLRSQIDRSWIYLHPFKELVSFDNKRRTVMTPLFQEGSDGRSSLILNIDTGIARILPWKGGLQNQFYDPSTDSTIVYNCGSPVFGGNPGFERFDGFNPLKFTELFKVDFGPIPPHVRCTDGFTGADFDPVERLQFILFRKGSLFFIAVSDIGKNQFLGLFLTDATAATFGLNQIIPGETFFSAQFVPAFR